MVGGVLHTCLTNLDNTGMLCTGKRPPSRTQGFFKPPEERMVSPVPKQVRLNGMQLIQNHRTVLRFANTLRCERRRQADWCTASAAVSTTISRTKARTYNSDATTSRSVPAAAVQCKQSSCTLTTSSCCSRSSATAATTNTTAAQGTERATVANWCRAARVCKTASVQNVSTLALYVFGTRLTIMRSVCSQQGADLYQRNTAIINEVSERLSQYVASM